MSDSRRGEFADLYTDLQQRLGYKFEDQTTLEQACSHRVLEPRGLQLADLGRALLNVCVRDMLFAQPRDARAAELTARADELQDDRTLAVIGRSLGLPRLIDAGGGGSGTAAEGPGTDTALADTVRALIAAVFTDAGKFEAAQLVVESLFAGGETAATPLATPAAGAAAPPVADVVMLAGGTAPEAGSTAGSPAPGDRHAALAVAAAVKEEEEEAEWPAPPTEDVVIMVGGSMSLAAAAPAADAAGAASASGTAGSAAAAAFRR